MRIGLDARMVRITGIGRYTAEIAAGLRALGQDVTALIAPRDVPWWRQEFPGAQFQIAPEPIYSWSEQLILPARLQRAGFDLVHFTNFNVPLGYRGRFVLTVHDLTPLVFAGERKTGWISRTAYRRVLASAVARAASIIVPSELVRAQLVALFGATSTTKTHVVQHGLGDEFRHPATPPVERAEVLRRLGVSAPFALYVGNLRNHKNIPTLLAAFAAFHADEPNSQLLLVGQTTAQQQAGVAALIEEKHLRRAVVISGELNNDELVATYDAARLLVLPSFVEGFGLPALEAAARGVPVLASETTPVREFLGRAILSFNPRSVDALADLMTLVWYDVNLRTRLGQAGQQLARTRSWTDVARDTLAAYDAVMHARTRA